MLTSHYITINCTSQIKIIKTNSIGIHLHSASEIDVHRQVPITDAKIEPRTKIALQNLLKKFNAIISKNSNDIGQMDLIEMHIATRPDATPIPACPYPLMIKHHHFLKQDIQNLIDV